MLASRFRIDPTKETPVFIVCDMAFMKDSPRNCTCGSEMVSFYWRTELILNLRSFCNIFMCLQQYFVCVNIAYIYILYIYIYIYTHIARRLVFAQTARNSMRSCHTRCVGSARVFPNCENTNIGISCISLYLSLPKMVPKSPLKQCLKHIPRNLQCCERYLEPQQTLKA